jgi:hypothetical protein
VDSTRIKPGMQALQLRILQGHQDAVKKIDFDDA